jgi:hypothetical protein
VAATLLLVGCGGTGDDSSTSASAPREGLSSRAKELDQATARVRRERERQRAASGSPRNESRTAAGPQGEDKQRVLPDTPPNPHADSGGGAAQFRVKGDNSIQESGTEASAASRDAAAAVLHAYLDARVQRDWDAACFYMSAGLVVGLERFTTQFSEEKGTPGCPQILAGFAASSSPAALAESAKVDVGSLRENEDRGFLLYRSADGRSYAMLMVREGDAWKVGTLEPALLG